MYRMAHDSDTRFRTLHSLRIRGMATPSALAEISGHDEPTTREHLGQFTELGFVTCKPARDLWQLTPEGRTGHVELLATDLNGVDLALLSPPYKTFVELNLDFKALCGDWQLRNGEINDHTDATYDKAVIKRLVKLDKAARPVVRQFADVLARFAPYEERLGNSGRRVAAGETKLFAGVMCGSYHDVWMELHEDLLLTQGIKRGDEGSF